MRREKSLLLEGARRHVRSTPSPHNKNNSQQEHSWSQPLPRPRKTQRPVLLGVLFGLSTGATIEESGACRLYLLDGLIAVFLVLPEELLLGACPDDLTIVDTGDGDGDGVAGGPLVRDFGVGEDSFDGGLSFVRLITVAEAAVGEGTRVRVRKHTRHTQFRQAAPPDAVCTGDDAATTIVNI